MAHGVLIICSTCAVLSCELITSQLVKNYYSSDSGYVKYVFSLCAYIIINIIIVIINVVVIL